MIHALAMLLHGVSVASAQDLPPSPVEVTVPEVEVPELPTAAEITAGRAPVPWRMVTFADLVDAEDCPAADAQRGRCIEEVRFLDLPAARGVLGRKQPAAVVDLAESAWWRSFASQEEDLWEGLAFRWSAGGDVLASTVLAAGYDTLPTPASSWSIVPVGRGAVAGPDDHALLQASAWTGTPDSAFPAVRYAVSDAEQAPAYAVLRGRFALRLGATGRPHPYDVMSADPVHSAPFFEQMYPFASHDVAGMRRPLEAFDLPRFPGKLEGMEVAKAVAARVAKVRLPEASFASFQTVSTEGFRSFTDDLSLQVAQFALEDFTPNHIRVFTALSAMVLPPGPTSGTGSSRRIVAAARGETDAAADIAARTDRSSFLLRAGFSLDITALSPEVVTSWTENLARQLQPDPARLAELRSSFQVAAGANLKTTSLPPIEVVDHASLGRWAEESAGPGVNSALVLSDLERHLLQSFLRELPERERQTTAAQILFDQLRHSAAGVFDDTPGARAAPQDIVGKVSAQWASQLGRHGFLPQPMAQRYGGIDPTAICTTQDGPAALAEPSFGAVNLDVLVRAPDRGPGRVPTEEVGEFLWDVRAGLPFLLVDDPERMPEVERLVQLPGKMAVYRLRWSVWTGWHLLWTEAALTDDARRSAVRTAAICDDTVLAEDALAPTLLRASLLADTFRSTSPVPISVTERDEVSPEGPAADLVTYLRAATRLPVQALARSTGGFLLVVGDADQGPVGVDLIPATPYARDQRDRGFKAYHTALWARFVPKDLEAEEAPLVYPAFRPTQLVESNSLHPRWLRPTVSDVTLSGGVGAFPLREIRMGCGAVDPQGGFVDGCSETDGVAQSTHSEGLSADVSALTTLWALDRPRLGVEAGLEVHLDASHEGNSWVYPDSDPSLTWMFRPSGGLLLGLRTQPPPAPLSGLGNAPRLWGVDRLDGRSLLGRTQVGLRLGFLVAPGYNGAEGTFLGELWAGVAARRNLAPVANLTPYNPRALYGAFVRVQYATPFVPSDTPRRYELVDGTTVIAGFRGNWNLKMKLPDPPKAK